MTSSRGINLFVVEVPRMECPCSRLCRVSACSHVTHTLRAHTAHNQISRIDDQCRKALPSPWRTVPRGWLTKVCNRCSVSVCAFKCELKPETKPFCIEHFPSNPYVGTAFAPLMSPVDLSVDLCVSVLLSIETPRVRHDFDTLCLAVSPRHANRVV